MTRVLALPVPPAGAGRTVHVFFPDFTSITGNVGNNAAGRVGTSQGAAVMANVTQGAPPAQVTTSYKGTQCWKWGSAVGGAGVAIWFNYRINPSRDQTSFPTGLDDRGVIETRWLMAFDRPAGDLSDPRDLGIGISPGNNNQNTFNPAVGAVYRAGTQFGPGGPGKLRFRSRGAQSGVGPPPYSADFDTTNTTFPNFDERNWNVYAIRMIGATSSGNGVCKALINGIQFASFDMSTGVGAFPAVNAGIGAVIGWLCGITNATNGEFDSMYFARGNLIMAASEADI